ncbi:hypothetical protein ACPF8X_38365, partial [Streptomyces sp. G35A]
MNGTTEVSTGAAVACLGTAAWLLGGRRAGARRARLLLAGGGAAASGPPGWDRVIRARNRIRRRLRVEWWSLAAGVALSVLGSSVLPLAAGAAGVPVLRRVRLAARERR